MIDRLIFVTGIILISFPFIGVYMAWKVWVAFAIGCVFIIYSVYNAARQNGPATRKPRKKPKK